MEQILAWAAAHPVLALIGYCVASALLNLVIAERSRVDAWCERHPRIAAVLKIVRAVGVDPWHLVAAASLFVNKQLPEASKRSTSLPRVPPLPLVMLSLLLLGCTGSLESAQAARSARAGPTGSPERCAELDDRRQLAGGSAKALAALSGGTGLATIPATDDKLETGLAVGAAVSAALAAGALYISEGAGESFARECL